MFFLFFQQLMSLMRRSTTVDDTPIEAGKMKNLEKKKQVVTGTLVVNDRDLRRLRSGPMRHFNEGSSFPSLMVTCSRGEDLTQFFGEGGSGSGSGSGSSSSSSSSTDNINQGGFDRVLCDTVCSGDGTFRKLPDLWTKWTVRVISLCFLLSSFFLSFFSPPRSSVSLFSFFSSFSFLLLSPFSTFFFFFFLLFLQPERSIQLHPLQLQLAHHACLLTRSNGGLLVYSTCSLHPLENEAIIAEMLRRHPYMELVDTKKENMLPLLIRRQGMSKWPLPRKA